MAIQYYFAYLFVVCRQVYSYSVPDPEMRVWTSLRITNLLQYRGDPPISHAPLRLQSKLYTRTQYSYSLICHHHYHPLTSISCLVSVGASLLFCAISVARPHLSWISCLLPSSTSQTSYRSRGYLIVPALPAFCQGAATRQLPPPSFSRSIFALFGALDCLTR